MKYILIISLIFIATETQAQLGRRLKDRAKQAAERKADQKVDEAVNKSADKIDSVITGKKSDKKNNPPTETNSTASGNSGSTDNVASENVAESIYKEVTIKTNIRCETGKKKLETILRDTDGVSSAMIDNDNGNLYLSTETPEVITKAIELIRQNGFTANGKKPTNPISDPCK